MANVTFDLLWRECMRELLDLLELEQPPEDFGSWKEDQVISHFSYLYIRYVLLYTSLEDCMDQHVHAQKRKDVQAAVESVMGRMLEVKALLMSASGTAFVNFDDILVDLKLTPSVLDIIAPRYCVDADVVQQRNQVQAQVQSVAVLLCVTRAECSSFAVCDACDRFGRRSTRRFQLTKRRKGRVRRRRKCR